MTKRGLPWQRALLAVGLLLAVFSLVLLPSILYPRLPTSELERVADAGKRIELQQAQSRLRNDVRSACLQGIAGLLVVIGAAATWQQVQVARDGQNTDRFNRAIEQLGSDSLDVRIGGIYALERLAMNSEEDRRLVQMVLGGFIRRRSPWLVGSPDGPAHPTQAVEDRRIWLRMNAGDVQAALGALARRSASKDAPRLFLSRVDLRSIRLENAQLARASLRHSNLARAVLRGSTLEGSDLTDADLRQADLDHVALNGASLRGAHLVDANLSGADLRGADLCEADLRARGLSAADLTGARADEATLWPEGFKPKAVSLQVQPRED